MLFVLICTYLGVWGCAYAAVNHWPGRCGFWLWYGVAMAVVPGLSAKVLGWIFTLANPAYGGSITYAILPFGIGLAALVYPASYLRMQRGE